MLTREVPYEAESAWGIVSQHIQGQLRPPREVNQDVPQGINQTCVRLLARDPHQRYPDAATLIVDLKRVKDNPDAFVDDTGLTVPLGGRDDMVPTTALTLSMANRLAELYLRARRSHRAQEWQAVVDIFDRIHALDPEYPDPEGLLVSAREALPAPETIITASNVGRIQLLRTMGREERKSWVDAFFLGPLKKKGHMGSVNSVAFSPDGRLLASGSESRDTDSLNDTVRLWGIA